MAAEAFQADAFQNDAFQMFTAGSPVYPPPSEVTLGVPYGPNGNDYVGEKVGGALWLGRR